MKVFILSVFAFAAVAHSAVIPVNVWPSTALVRTPSLDSAVIQSEQLNGAFSYSTVENHAYAHAPVIQTYATYPWNYYPNIYYPTYTIVQQVPSLVPGISGIPSDNNPMLPLPGQPPIDVEDPADNTENQNGKKENNNDNDDDTVSVESI